MHRRELGADGATVVLDLLAFDPNGPLSVLAETRGPKSDVGGLDSHARLKNTTLCATSESRCGIESGTTGAGPEAQANVAENSGNGTVELRVDAEIRNNDASDKDAEILGQPSGKRRTVIAEQEALRGIEGDANAKTERPRSRRGRLWLGAGVAGLCAGREHEGFPFGRPKVACAPSPRLHVGWRQGLAFLV